MDFAQVLRELGRLATDFDWDDQELLLLGWTPELRAKVEERRAEMAAVVELPDAVPKVAGR